MTRLTIPDFEAMESIISNFENTTIDQPLNLLNSQKESCEAILFAKQHDYCLEIPVNMSAEQLTQQSFVLTNFKDNSKNYTIKITEAIMEGRQSEQSTFDIYTLETSGFGKEKESLFFAFFKKTTNEHFFDFFDSPLDVGLNNYRYFKNGIEIEIDKVVYIFCHLRGYWLIYSKQKTTLEIFKKACRTIGTSFGLISGVYIGGSLFLFSFSNSQETSSFNHFSISRCFADEVSSIWKLIDNKQPLLSKENFAALCKLVIKETHIARAIYLFKYASTVDVYAAGVLYCAALETLAEEVASNTEKPINDKKKAKKLIDALKQTAQQLFNPIPDVIDKKLTNINQPTNADKLTKPFEVLKIPIEEQDKANIAKRNKFLHGENIVITDTKFEDAIKEFMNINLNLFFLASAIIMKKIDYQGSIFDYTNYIEAKKGTLRPIDIKKEII